MILACALPWSIIKVPRILSCMGWSHLRTLTNSLTCESLDSSSDEWKLTTQFNRFYTHLNVRTFLVFLFAHEFVSSSACADPCFDTGSQHSHSAVHILKVPVLVHRQWVFCGCLRGRRESVCVSRILFIFCDPVCAIASRYYSEKSEIYPIAMHFAKRAAADGLLNGWKSVELSQAYIILSIYSVPVRRWEEDRSWLYTGLAIRYVTLTILQNESSC